MKTQTQEELPFQKNNLARLSILLTGLAVASFGLTLFILASVGIGQSKLLVLAFAPPMFAFFGFISGALTLCFDTGRRGRYLAFSVSALVICGLILSMYWSHTGYN